MARIVWSDGYRDTQAMNEHGVLLRVRFLPGSKQWGVYLDGVLRRKRETRDQAKREALSWRHFRPANSVPCVACNGTGRVRRSLPSEGEEKS